MDEYISRKDLIETLKTSLHAPLYCVETAPTADVVSKEEAERLQSENKVAHKVIKNLEGDIEVYREAYKNVRIDTAKDIFAEIKRRILFSPSAKYELAEIEKKFLGA